MTGMTTAVGMHSERRLQTWMGHENSIYGLLRGSLVAIIDKHGMPYYDGVWLAMF